MTVPEKCLCAKCDPQLRFMRLCPRCGNKRCPKTEDHEMGCTNSNAVGQVGVRGGPDAPVFKCTRCNLPKHPSTEAGMCQMCKVQTKAERADVLEAEVEHLTEELRRITEERDSPITDNFLESVRREAWRQRARWDKQDQEKLRPSDWFWLVGWLLGKAVHQPEKRNHHIITAAATLANWYRVLRGK